MSSRSDLNWEQVHYRDATIVDLHAHPSLKVSLFHRVLSSRLYPSSRAFNPFSVRTDFDKLQRGGVDVLHSVVYAPERGILEECPPLKLLSYLMPRAWKRVYGRPYFEITMQMLDDIETAINQASNPQTGKPLGRVARSVTELNEILSTPGDRPVAFVHCIEGGHSLEGSLENLERLFQRGVAYLTLAHFFENEIVHPCYPWPESMQKFNWFRGERDLTKGLKPFGEQAVEKMVELGMLIDVSHCTPPARARIYEIVGTRAPLLATHVGAYEINPDPYNLKDWEIRKIAESGGMVGVIFMNFWLMPHETQRGLNFITRTLEHFVKVAGIEHAGIGTDFDGFTDPPDDLKDASELPKLTQRLLAEGFTADEITRILGSNALRVLRMGWGKK
jgi:microsomal dipeptidase-like Zn-dependent dipeptidase